jgi:hypothetical protein
MNPGLVRIQLKIRGLAGDEEAGSPPSAKAGYGDLPSDENGMKGNWIREKYGYGRRQMTTCFSAWSWKGDPP